LPQERIVKGHAELIGTVRRIEAKPGAINVIPAVLFIDVRAPDCSESMRSRHSLSVEGGAEEITAAKSSVAGNPRHARRASGTDGRAVEREGLPVRRLPSGAGRRHGAHGHHGICALRALQGGINTARSESKRRRRRRRVLLDFIEHFRLPA
jgi:hypothetical protein